MAIFDHQFSLENNLDNECIYFLQLVSFNNGHIYGTEKVTL